jgi:fructose 1,6-bisphosphatase
LDETVSGWSLLETSGRIAEKVADNIRAKGHFDPHQQAEDMTAPTIIRTPQNNL